MKVSEQCIESGNYRMFSRDVTAGILMFLNKGMAIMTNYYPPGIELYYNSNVFFLRDYVT